MRLLLIKTQVAMITYVTIISTFNASIIIRIWIDNYSVFCIKKNIEKIRYLNSYRKRRVLGIAVGACIFFIVVELYLSRFYTFFYTHLQYVYSWSGIDTLCSGESAPVLCTFIYIFYPYFSRNNPHLLGQRSFTLFCTINATTGFNISANTLYMYILGKIIISTNTCELIWNLYFLLNNWN